MLLYDLDNYKRWLKRKIMWDDVIETSWCNSGFAYWKYRLGSRELNNVLPKVPKKSSSIRSLPIHSFPLPFTPMVRQFEKRILFALCFLWQIASSTGIRIWGENWLETWAFFSMSDWAMNSAFGIIYNVFLNSPGSFNGVKCHWSWYPIRLPG